MRALLLPCETRSREFDAKLLLALHAARAGREAWVGAKKVMDLQLDRLPPAVYVGKSLTDRTAHNFDLARRAGHRVVAWDEEGLVWASREVYWRTKVGERALKLPELLLAWGDENARAWREFPGFTGTPVAVTGNPRSDLLDPAFRSFFEARQREIRARFGRFVILNTNFSRVNHIQPAQNRHLKWLRENRPDDPRGGFAAHKYELFGAFKSLIPELAEAAAPDTVVIRPHPSERSETWTELAAAHSNVTVERSGNVVPWLLASRGVIHNGCTTAVEAFQLQRPALAWMPVRNVRFDHPLPNNLSFQADRSAQMSERVRQFLDDPEAAHAEQADEERRSLLARNIAPGPELACQRILEALEPVLTRDAPPEGARPRLARGVLAARRALRAIEHRLPGQGNSRAYLEHMFPSLVVDEVRSQVDGFSACLEPGRPVRVEAVFPGVFRLGPA